MRWRPTRDEIRDCLAHVIWGVRDENENETALCSCGWKLDDTYFDDDVVMTEIEEAGSHPRYVIAYPDWDFDATGRQVAIGHDGEEYDLDSADVRWLLDQPGLPDEFRRAAAVHLQP